MRRRSTATSAGGHLPPRPGLGADRSSFMSYDSAWSDRYSNYVDSDNEVWQEDDDYAEARRARPSRKDEQMSPVAVVLYVVFFYFVWQILTRSDDTEILEHLPTGSPLLSPHALDHAASQSPQLPYFQYQLPQITSPMASAQSEPTSTWRVALGMLVYPIYLAVTLIVIPLPYLVNAVNLVLSVVGTILYPVTSTARLLGKTFLIAPLGVVMRFLHALYPVYVFVGGVVGVGTFLGVSAGWIGRMILQLLIGPKQEETPKRRRSRRSKTHSSRTDKPATATGSGAERERERERERSNSHSHRAAHRSRPVSGTMEHTVYDRDSSVFRDRRMSTSFEGGARPLSFSGISEPRSRSATMMDASRDRPLSSSFEPIREGRTYERPIVFDLPRDPRRYWDVLQVGDDLVAVAEGLEGLDEGRPQVSPRDSYTLRRRSARG